MPLHTGAQAAYGTPLGQTYQQAVQITQGLGQIQQQRAQAAETKRKQGAEQQFSQIASQFKGNPKGALDYMVQNRIITPLQHRTQMETVTNREEDQRRYTVGQQGKERLALAEQTQDVQQRGALTALAKERGATGPELSAVATGALGKGFVGGMSEEPYNIPLNTTAQVIPDGKGGTQPNPNYVSPTAGGGEAGVIPFGWKADENGVPEPYPTGPAGLEYLEAAAAAKKAGIAGDFDPSTLPMLAREYRMLGKAPKISRSDTKNMAKFYNEVEKQAREEGDASGVEQARRMAQYSADKGSLGKLQATRDSMSNFVNNMYGQIDRVSDKLDQAFRADTRLLNLPIRAWKKLVVGSPIESIIDLYVTEISTESTKIASGATQSISEVSEGNREKWESIHDLNLSGADMKQLLQETRHAATLRMETLDGGVLEAQNRLRGSDPLVTNRAAPSQRGRAAPAEQPGVAPQGVTATLPGGRVVTSDGKGGWN